MTGQVVRGVLPDEEKAVDRIKSLLTGLGCYECVTYSFAAMSELDKLRLPEDDKLRKMVKILNPLGDEQGYLRTSGIPDILKVVANNVKMKVNEVRLFETGRVYLPTAGTKDLPEENKYVCIALTGSEDFFTLKGVVQNLLESFGIKDAKYLSEAPVYYHPGRKASVYSDGEKLGDLGEVHPDVAESYDISSRVYVAELSLRALLAAADDTKRYVPLPKFPAAERDLALILGEDVPAADVLECIRQNGGEFFESAALFDVYTGSQVGEGKKSLAFSIVFRAKDRTLRDEEANDARDAIVDAAQAAFGAHIRE